MTLIRNVRRTAITAGLAASLTGAATALANAPAPASPYAGLTDRAIKALSAEEVDDLLAGRGMGLALAAELNGYPGPKHVLELAAALSLTPEQVEVTTALWTEMARQATRLGTEIVAREAALDRSFASGAATAASVRQDVAEIGRLQGELRAAHLTAHLAMRDILTREQLAAYARLRGYAGEDAPARGHDGHGTH